MFVAIGLCVCKICSTFLMFSILYFIYYRSSFITKEEKKDNDKVEMVPAELLTHAECIGKLLLIYSSLVPIHN